MITFIVAGHERHIAAISAEVFRKLLHIVDGGECIPRKDRDTTDISAYGVYYSMKGGRWLPRILKCLWQGISSADCLLYTREPEAYHSSKMSACAVYCYKRNKGELICEEVDDSRMNTLIRRKPYRWESTKTKQTFPQAPTWYSITQKLRS